MTAPTEDLIARIETEARAWESTRDDGSSGLAFEALLTEAALALRALQQELEFAVALVKELSDELASEVEGRYESLLPQLQHRFDRDMTTVEDARAFLAARSALTGSAQG